jgi:NurA-like 5'-3' nuclease
VKGASADYVYIIRVDDKNVSVSLCDQMRADAKRRKIDRMAVGYSRINVQNLPSQTLYVGRSRDMGTRVRQHLGADLFKPYALHFELWAKNNAIEVTIDYMRFEDRDDLLVQAIEDGLWESLKPAFGRKGSR